MGAVGLVLGGLVVTGERTGGARPAVGSVDRPVRSAAASRTSKVLLVEAALLLVSALLWWAVLRDVPPPPTAPAIPWYVLAAMFGLAELCVVHVQVRREAQTISASEIPLLLGLVFASPATVVWARVVGPLLVFALHRRQSPLKITYNLCLQVCDVVVAYAGYELVRGSAALPQTRAVVALYVGVIAAAVVDGLATRLVIGLVEGTLSTCELLLELREFPPVAAMVATFGLVAAYALQRDTASGWALAACLGILLLAYRLYASLAERHLVLERIYQFTEAISSSSEIDQVLSILLGRTKDLLRAEYAELVLADGDQPLLRVRTDAGGRIERSRVTDAEVGCLRPLLTGGGPLLLPRRARNPEARRLLADRGLREAIAVPLRGQTGPLGVLTVADRLGDVRTFDARDVRLLETVANHAGVALQNSALVSRLRHEALHDGLTGLPNRVLFQTRAHAALAQLAAGELPGLAVMIMDLDGFKDINDTLGHQYGDDLLVELTARLAAAPFSASTTVARLGGDEFAILLLDVADTRSALTAAEVLLGTLERPVRLNEVDVQVGASIGVALAPQHGGDMSSLLKKADVAMYEAKGLGGGVRLYDAAMTAPTPARLALVAELREGIARGELEVFGQPQRDLRTGRIDTVEALVRWRHPEHGLLAPDVFVPLAERTGLIQPLTRAVLHAALSACSDWQRRGREVAVAVNVSVRSLRDADLLDDVLHALERYDVPPSRLTLEITESSVMSDPVRTIAVLRELSAHGVRLSVDDFGTGYSSLSYLQRLPVDEVKIDRSFVTTIRQDPDNASIVRSIIDLGTNLHLDVVAEGVEDDATRQLLVAMGCTRAQGFGLVRPMPLEAFGRWLEQEQGTGLRKPLGVRRQPAEDLVLVMPSL